MADLDPQAIQERAADLRQWADLTKSEAIVTIMREDAELFEALLADRAELEERLAKSQDSHDAMFRGRAAAEADREAAREALAALTDSVSHSGPISDETYAAWKQARAVLARLSSANQETP